MHGAAAYLVMLRCTALRSERESELARARDLQVRGLVLVAECMATHYDGHRPSGYQSGHVLGDNGLSEYSTVQNVPDGSVG